MQCVVSLVWKDVQDLQNICATLPSTMCKKTLPLEQHTHTHTHTSALCSCAITPVHSLSVLELPRVHVCVALQLFATITSQHSLFGSPSTSAVMR